MTLVKSWIVMCASCLFTADRAMAQWFVDQNAPGPGVDGLSWATAYTTLQPALNDAGNSPSGPLKDVLVAEGTYLPTTQFAPFGLNPTRELSFIMRSEVRLHGGYLGNASLTPSMDPDSPDGSFNKTILSGIHPTGVRSYHVIVATLSIVGPIQVLIDGFRIDGGLADGPTNTDKDKGGGLYNFRAITIVENVRFRNNGGVFGGGAYHRGTNRFGIRHSTFRTNVATNGAGLFVGPQSFDVELANTRFRENGDVNTTLRGGGIFVDVECEIEAANLVIDDNEAKDAGGGIYVNPDDTDNPDLHRWRHCTIAYNRVSPIIPQSGAGVHYDPGVSPPGDAFFDNCIIWGNISGYDILVLGFPVTARSSDIGTASGIIDGGGNLSVDPLFVDAPNRNLRLSSILPGTPFSPCIDFGDDLLIGDDFLDIDGDGNLGGPEPLPLDKDLKPRQVDFVSVNGTNAADMGAYEAPPAVPPIEK